MNTDKTDNIVDREEARKSFQVSVDSLNGFGDPVATASMEAGVAAVEKMAFILGDLGKDIPGLFMIGMNVVPGFPHKMASDFGINYDENGFNSGTITAPNTGALLFSEEELRAVILHELAHLALKQPLVTSSEAEKQLQEMAADKYVVDHGYAQALVKARLRTTSYLASYGVTPDRWLLDHLVTIVRPTGKVAPELLDGFMKVIDSAEKVAKAVQETVKGQRDEMAEVLAHLGDLLLEKSVGDPLIESLKKYGNTAAFENGSTLRSAIRDSVLNFKALAEKLRMENLRLTPIDRAPIFASAGRDGVTMSFYMPLLLTPDELTGIFAHEIAHIRLGHSAVSSDSVPKNIASRWEFEADRWATINGYGKALIAGLERLERWAGAAKGLKLLGMDDPNDPHPETVDRIEKIREAMAEMESIPEEQRPAYLGSGRIAA